MDPKLLQAILELLALPAGEVLPKLESLATRNPARSPQINALRNFLATCYELLPGNAVAAFAEAMALFKTGSGPVAPDIGDTG
jgi:hypothetical protein